jgi:hypothetical protein
MPIVENRALCARSLISVASVYVFYKQQQNARQLAQYSTEFRAWLVGVPICDQNSDVLESMPWFWLGKNWNQANQALSPSNWYSKQQTQLK